MLDFINEMQATILIVWWGFVIRRHEFKAAKLEQSSYFLLNSLPSFSVPIMLIYP